MALSTLTSWEVDEFVGEVSIRPTMWLGKARLWVRRRFGEHQFAVKFVLEGTLYRVYVKTLSTQTQEEAERYVEWLVNKFTSYSDRKRVERLLTYHLNNGKVDVVELAIEIMSPTLEEPIVIEEEEHQQPEADPPEVFTPLLVPKVVYVAHPKRSRYLQNLLKGK